MTTGRKTLLLLAVVIISLSIFGGSIAWAAEDTVTGIVYSVTGTEATITGFTPPVGFNGNLVIPTTLSGCNVTSIGADAFRNHKTDLTSVTIPDGVTSIGANAFRDCWVLDNITLPDSVTTIGSWAFAGLAITKVTVPSGVAGISDNVFSWSPKLTEVTIPASVTSIHKDAFYNTPITTIYGYSGTYAETYAKSKGIIFVDLTSNASINPTTASFNKAPEHQADVSTTITWNDATSVIDVKKAGVSIGADKFDVSANTLTIKKEYLAAQPIGSLVLSVEFDQGMAVTLTINIESSVIKATISPNTVSFNNWNQADVSTAITWNEAASVTDVKKAGVSIGSDRFDVSANTLTIKKEYLATQAPGSLALTVEFDGGEPAILTINIAALTYTITDGKAMVTGFTAPAGFDGILVIPAILGGASVTSIGIDAFRNHKTDLTSVTIPDSVISIGDNTFRDCWVLTSITIPNSVASIGSWAFAGSAITSVTVPSGITGISDNVFAWCPNLTSITIPVSVTSIHETAFFNTPIAAIYGYWGSYAQNYANTKGINFIALDNHAVINPNTAAFNKDAGHQADVSTAITWNDAASVTDVKKAGVSVGTAAYTMSGNTVTIKKEYLATQLTGSLVLSVEFDKGMPASLTIEIQSSIVNATILPVSTSNNNINPADVSTAITWNDAQSVTDVKQAGVSVGTAAYTVSGNIITIKKDYLATQSAGTLELTVEFDRGDPATFTISMVGLAYTVTGGEATITGFTAPEGFAGNLSVPAAMGGVRVTAIGDEAFRYCTGLTSITIPEGVASLGVYAFGQCHNLTNVNLPDSLTRIGDRAFHYCGMKSLTIPKGVKSIGERAFLRSSLESLIIPDNVTSMGESTFLYCENLTSITLSNGLTAIPEAAFAHCYNLNSVTIPGSITRIGISAFVQCKALSSITIPDSVTTIDEGAFAVCISLTNLTIPGSVANINNQVFEYCENLTTIIIPQSVTSFGNYVFKNCPQLTIYGYAGSAAETYAGKNNIPFYNLNNCAVITPTVITFDKNPANQADVTTTITWNSATSVTAVKKGDAALTVNTDYTVDSTTLTIKKGYLATQAVGELILTVEFNEGLAASLIISIVESKTLVSITAPSAITGAANGTIKTAEAMGLPAKLSLVTSDGNVEADVTWDLAACSYEPAVTTEQTFTLSGTVTLPAGVINPNNVLLATSISITVNAAVPAATYPLTITAATGGSITTGSGNYAADTVINITATPASGYSFNKWASTGGGTFANANSASTTYTMPANPATITATFSSTGTNGTGDSNDGSSGDSDGGSSGGGSSATSSGTQVTSSGRTISQNGVILNFPAGTVESDILVQLKEAGLTTGMTLPDGSKLLSRIMDIIKDKSGNFSRPVTITLSFNKSGFNPDEYEIAICYYDENTGKWIALDNIKLNLEDGTISGEVQHFTKFAVIATPKTKKPSQPVTPQPTVNIPSDISGHWAKDSIMKLINAGVISGYPDGTFKPDKAVTRAEFTVMLVKALNRETRTGKTFTDTASHWAKDSIATAAAHGIISGYDGNTFGPDDLITREQAAVIIARAAKLEAAASQLNFTDCSTISSWAQAGVSAAVKGGIITGYPDNSFRPQGNTTRAEAAVMIGKLLKDNKEVFK